MIPTGIIFKGYGIEFSPGIHSVSRGRGTGTVERRLENCRVAGLIMVDTLAFLHEESQSTTALLYILSLLYQ